MQCKMSNDPKICRIEEEIRLLVINFFFFYSTSSSSDSEGSYCTNEASTVGRFESNQQLNEAIEILQKHLKNPDSIEFSLMVIE